jgi:hypothetical protein
LDFFISPDGIDSQRILSAWGAMIPNGLRIRGLSFFGDLFLEDSTGAVLMFDLISWELNRICTCWEEFEWDIANGEGQQEWLMAPLARRAIESGISLGDGQCFGFRIPPRLNGALAVDNLVPLDLHIYHQGLAKLLPQILDLPLGTQIVIRPQ